MSTAGAFKPLTFALLRRLADGEFHSGEALAQQFGVTRATVNNALQDVGNFGLTLYSVRGRGYRLARPLQWLDADRVLAGLGAARNDLHIEILDHATSSNALLLQRAAQGEASGTVLAVEWQNAGRGRMGKTWHSGLGDALTFSVLWRFESGLAALSGLSLVVGLAMMRALDELGVPGAGLKWPNDVLLKDGKLAGILLEAQGDMLGPSAVVIGIGLNLSLPEAMRERIDQKVSDLASLDMGLPERNGILAVLLKHLAFSLREFAGRGFAPMRAEWESRHVFQQQLVKLLLPDGSHIAGMALGVTDDGALRLATAQGEQIFKRGRSQLEGRVVLLLDVGNSRCKWALVKKGVWAHQGVVGNTEWMALQNAFAALPQPSRILASNVAGEAMAQRLRAVCAAWTCSPEFVTARARQCGVSNGYQQPERLGSDRWAALIAAWQHVQGASLVVNCGTATTVDALSAQGEFLGGLIVPGVSLMRHSLATNAAQLKAELGTLQDFPCNTADAIHSGMMRATLGAIRHQFELLRARCGTVRCLLGGGAAGVVQPYLDLPLERMDNLVLKGLQIIGESKA